MKIIHFHLNRQACEDGGDREARGNMLLGSLYAGIAFANSPCAGVHALAYPLGSHFKIPHGLANSLMLPHVVRFNGELQEARDFYRFNEIKALKLLKSKSKSSQSFLNHSNLKFNNLNINHQTFIN